ncbi:MAG: hypothetical protein A2527_08180 [Candidatus Lambdaproteobacteria bacterium RIFOXYD2_FULL_50_16]|uniref:Uncharacterized protein n=1 Tax=Candidatus Lambdaproteobacteria bacterium RIFOXYD2_FULL_50_16 TaxID=1817772 RepID=A0A1F6GAN5_9PROT|nr:MAG: hypothetical protein A2527_08180 [Candidatus Lambdaproteobacteria bacterium RIFOXYD2_FULL_50_16]
MFKGIKIWWMVGGIFLLVGCNSDSNNPYVKRCQQTCETSPILIGLASKVAYKPIKLCKQRCVDTEGTCTDQKISSRDHQACVFFGINAGRKPGESGPLLKFN